MDPYLKILTAVMLAYIVYTLVSQNKQTQAPESFTNMLSGAAEEEEADEDEEEDVSESKAPVEVTGYTGDSDALELNKPQESNINLGSCGGKSQFLSTNLLPKNDPKMSDDDNVVPSLHGQNFIDSYKYMVGSQSQSLRNANYQLRSDPMNPQENVCPWNQSTIGPEKRRNLDIGAGSA